MEENEKDRTEEATPFKLKRAREKGSVARGMDLGFATALAAFLAYAWIAAPDFAAALAQSTRDVVVSGQHLAEGNGALLTTIRMTFSAVLTPMILLAGVTFAFVLLFELLQTGVVFSAQPLKPDFTRLNPAKGLKRLFSLRMLFETFKNTFKLVAYSVVGWLVISDVAQLDIGNVTGARELLPVAARAAFKLLAAFFLVALLFAVLDQIIVRHDFRKRMKMSRRELKREQRDREGEPRLKQKRKQLHKEFVSLSQSLRGLRGADVLIVNPRHIALGLRYDAQTMSAPIVVSIGLDGIAQRLRRLALLYGIPVIENRALAQELLRSTRLNQPIPEHCYQQVADIYNRLRRSEA